MLKLISILNLDHDAPGTLTIFEVYSQNSKVLVRVVALDLWALTTIDPKQKISALKEHLVARFIAPNIADDDQYPAGHAPDNRLTMQYTFISYSTGTMLDNEMTFEWYKLKANQLIEMHETEGLAHLSRAVVDKYVQPYFRTRVRALRNATSESTENEDEAKLRKRQKLPLEWKDRWVTVQDGKLYLSLSRNRKVCILVLVCTA